MFIGENKQDIYMPKKVYKNERNSIHQTILQMKEERFISTFKHLYKHSGLDRRRIWTP